LFYFLSHPQEIITGVEFLAGKPAALYELTSPPSASLYRHSLIDIERLTRILREYCSWTKFIKCLSCKGINRSYSYSRYRFS